MRPFFVPKLASASLSLQKTRTKMFGPLQWRAETMKKQVKKEFRPIQWWDRACPNDLQGVPATPRFFRPLYKSVFFSKIRITRPVGECFVAEKTMRSGICWVAPFASPNRAWAAPPRGGSQEIAPDATGDAPDAPGRAPDAPGRCRICPGAQNRYFLIGV